MPVALLISLITQVGLPLAMKLIDLYQKNPNATVTPEQWEALKKEISTPFADLAGPK
jgi:hypothetical protein